MERIDIGGAKLAAIPDADGNNRLVVYGSGEQTGVTATIAANASISNDIDLVERRACRLVMPTAWTAAVITFQVFYDGVTWGNLYDETGTEVSYTVVAGASMRLPIADWLGIRRLRIRSGTQGTPVVQAAARSIVVVAQ